MLTFRIVCPFIQLKWCRWPLNWTVCDRNIHLFTPSGWQIAEDPASSKLEPWWKFFYIFRQSFFINFKVRLFCHEVIDYLMKLFFSFINHFSKMEIFSGFLGEFFKLWKIKLTFAKLQKFTSNGWQIAKDLASLRGWWPGRWTLAVVRYFTEISVVEVQEKLNFETVPSNSY